MTGPVDPAFVAWIDEARAVPILEAARLHGCHLKRAGQEHVGACPICGGRRDKLAVHAGKGLFTCDHGSGPGGDVIALVQHLTASSFKRACEYLTGRGPPDRSAAETPEEREERRRLLDAAAARRTQEGAAREAQTALYREEERQRCYDIWRRGTPIAGTPVEEYLALRGLVAPPRALLKCARFHKLFSTRPAAGAGRPEVVHQGPAMLAAIVGADGHFSGLHVTWIDLARPGGKAVVADPETGVSVPAKKVRGVKKGGRIELARAYPVERLFVGEGIETVLSVWLALSRKQPALAQGAAFWSAVDLGNMAGPAARGITHPTATRVDSIGRSRRRQVPGPDPDPAGVAIAIPDSVRELYLLGDGDSDRFATQTALERAGRKHARPGRAIHVAFAPDGLDFNDVLMGRAA